MNSPSLRGMSEGSRAGRGGIHAATVRWGELRCQPGSRIPARGSGIHYRSFAGALVQTGKNEAQDVEYVDRQRKQQA